MFFLLHRERNREVVSKIRPWIPCVLLVMVCLVCVDSGKHHRNKYGNSSLLHRGGSKGRGVVSNVVGLTQEKDNEFVNKGKSKFLMVDSMKAFSSNSCCVEENKIL